MKRIVTLTISILLLFGSLSACTQSIATALSEQENLPEVNWYYEFFSDKDDKVAVPESYANQVKKRYLEKTTTYHIEGRSFVVQPVFKKENANSFGTVLLRLMQADCEKSL